MASEAVIESRHDHDQFFCGLLMDYTIVSRSICDEVFRESDKCRKYELQPPCPLQGI